MKYFMLIEKLIIIIKYKKPIQSTKNNWSKEIVLVLWYSLIHWETSIRYFNVSNVVIVIFKNIKVTKISLNVFFFNELIFKCVFCLINLVCKITNKGNTYRYLQNFNTFKNYITPHLIFTNKNDKLRYVFLQYFFYSHS